MKIIIHPIVYILLFIAMITGMFVEMIIVFSIVFFHEIGHLLAAKIFKWRIQSLKLLFFGGVLETEEHCTRPLHEELIVTLSGPLQHLWIYIFISIFGDFIFSPNIIETIYTYNSLVLLFNLLPVFPLDGGKIIFLISQILLPFKKAHVFILIFSTFAILLLSYIYTIYFGYNLSLLFLFTFLLFEIYIEWKYRQYHFFRFLLTRLTNRYRYHQTEIILCNTFQFVDEKIAKIYRFRNHIFLQKGSFQQLSEQQFLKDYYFKTNI